MGAVKQRAVAEFLKTVEFNPVEDELIVVRRKAKVGIVCLDQDGRPGFFVATRSKYEKTRKLGPDWPGGSLKVRERPHLGLEREGNQEFPGLDIINPIRVAKAKRTRENIKTVTTIVLANANEPEGGLVFGLNEDDEPEHCAVSIVSFERFQELDEMPRKYREAVASHAGQAAIANLIETAQPLIIPEGLQETRW